MNLDEYTDQQERLTRIDALQENAEWLKENWESSDSFAVAKRLGIMKGDIETLVELAETDQNQEDT